MTRKKNVFWIVYALLFGAIGIITSISTLAINEDRKVLGYVTPILCCIAIVVGMVYLIKGYHKQDAKIFKAFLITYGIFLLLRVPTSCLLYSVRPFAAMGASVSSAEALAIVTTQFFAKDLGQKTSLVLAGYSLIITYLFTIIIVIVCKGTLRGGDIATMALNIGNIRHSVLATIFYVGVRSKYVDKNERGTK